MYLKYILEIKIKKIPNKIGLSQYLLNSFK